jgi:multidrug efflux pump subunit AcrA (membrane-fusion protein)
MRFAIFKEHPFRVVAAALCLALLAWLTFRPAAMEVDTFASTFGPMVVTVDAEGRTRVRNKYRVTAPVSGRLSRIQLEVGNSVPRDYPLATIDPNPPRPRPPSELEGFPNTHAVTVYAPAAGKILQIIDKSERQVTAGTPLLEIGDPTDIEVVVDVLSSDAVQIRPGSEVMIDTANGTDPIKAVVRIIEPQAITKVSSLGVEEKRVNVVAAFVGPKPPFGDNFRLDCRIVVWRSDRSLTVPRGALFRVGEEWRVFAVQRGRAHERAVRVGHLSRTNAEITDGLAEGEVVVVHPPSTLADGVRVSSN